MKPIQNHKLFPHYESRFTCIHPNIHSNSFGETCLDCGKVLAGFGFWGFESKECIHHFIDCGDGLRTCLYCSYEEDVKHPAADDCQNVIYVDFTQKRS